MEKIYLKLDELTEIISNEIKLKITEMNITIKIACVIIGNDPSSLSYLRGMQKRAKKLGFEVDIIELDAGISETDFLYKIESLNLNKDYCGIIVQVPLPKSFDSFKLANIIDYKKDIDGINPMNIGMLVSGKPFMIPATAWAVDITLTYISKKFDYKLTGKNAAIIGRSLTVGKPAFHLLLQKNITTTIVHTKTVDTETITSNSDIIVDCCGIPELVNENWIKENAIVIDVGIHSIENEDKTYKLCGDVKSESALKKASVVTAVPRGIGSVTSTLLFANALKGYYKIIFNKEINFNFEK